MRVTTAGGTSAPFTRGFTSLTSTAASGTPADAAQASANPGQSVTLNGTGLSTSTDVLLRYIDSSGNPQTLLINPTFASADGTNATFVVPDYFNGTLTVHVAGSAAAPLLQIVPVLTSATVTGTGVVQLRGHGFVEGNGSVYHFPGGSVTDTSTSSDPIDVIDVYVGYPTYYEGNAGVNLSLPTSGSGILSVTTTGGTSAPLTWNAIHPNLGTLYDVAFDRVSGILFVATSTEIKRIDAATGQTLATLSLPGGGSGAIGLQVLPVTMSLAGISVPARSLLVTNGGASFDKIFALNPTTGAILATLDLGQNIDPVAGLYDSVRGSLFVLNGSSDQVVRLNPATGAVQSTFATPFDINYGGLALDPVTGNLWIGSSQTGSVAEVTATGTLVRTIDLGITDQISGLAFNTAGKLLVSSNRGVIYTLDLTPVTPTASSVTAIAAVALDGTPTDGAKASANVGQTIELVGTNFTATTQVVFSTRNNDGSVGTVSIRPTAVKADGTRLQVIVPDLAQTGTVTVLGGTGSVVLQIVPVLTAISGQPGVDVGFSLFGSGFMEGASTITVGGVVLTDRYTNAVDGDVLGVHNGQFNLVSQLTVEGPITITTAGGSMTLSGPLYGQPPFVEFSGLSTRAVAGTAADNALPSANTGQSITLTGQGFTSGTLVEFQAADDTGATGQLIRGGTVNSDGTRFTVNVPALARTGSVRVVGSNVTFPLQIVPTLRSVGGVVATNNHILLEGTGLVEGALTVSIDGQVVSTLNVIATSDQGLDQQVVDLVVPAGVGSGVISVTTAGGTFTLRPATTIAPLADLVLGPDSGDTLATAVAINLPSNSKLNINSQSIGDNAFGSRDVDLYRFTATGGDVISIDVTRQNASLSNSYVRLFDVAGNEIAADTSAGPDGNSRLAFVRLPASGDYYIGVSSYPNFYYNPSQADGSGNGYYTGPYQLSVQRLDGGSTTLTGITGASLSGTAGRAGIASANTGQTILLTGSGIQAGDRVVFTTMNDSGHLETTTVTPVSIASEGLSLQVAVPTNATSGMVRLERENAGVFLQIVPTLFDVYQEGGDALYHNGTLKLSGSGFVEGGVTIHFGAESLTDTSPSSGVDVYDAYTGQYPNYYNQNGGISLTVPNGVPTGPITVSTLGGTSAAFSLGFTGIVSTALSGTPANALVASANPGQAITLRGYGFDMTTDVVFPTIDSNGNRSERVVRPLAVKPDGTELTVIVPANAAAADTISIVGDQNNTQALLQIVPVLDSVDMTSVASDGTTQGYLQRDLGQLKVEATARQIREIDTTIEVSTVADRWRPELEAGNAVFCCVDTISSRTTIWRSLRLRCEFWCDTRMRGEVLRVLTASTQESRVNYGSTLFAQADAQPGPCTAKSTLFTANIAAGMAVHQFTRMLRGIPCDVDMTFSLLSGELTATTLPHPHVLA